MTSSSPGLLLIHDLTPPPVSTDDAEKYGAFTMVFRTHAPTSNGTNNLGDSATMEKSDGLGVIPSETQQPTEQMLAEEYGKRDELKEPDSYPWSKSNNARFAGLTALFTVLILFLAVFFALQICRKKRHKSRAKRSVHRYLTRFQNHDFKIHQSPVGGWNVVFSKRLTSRVRSYWSGELPDITDSATIVFDEENPKHNIRDKSLFDWDLNQHETDSDSSSDEDSWFGYNHVDEKLEGSSSMCSGSTKIIDNTASRGQTLQQQIRQKDDILAFLGDRFSSDDIQLKLSLTCGGWSVLYCNRLAEGENDYKRGDDGFDIEEETVVFLGSHSPSPPAFQYTSRHLTCS